MVARRYESNGTLKGTNTLDKVAFYVDSGTIINYTVAASGSGSNKLRVRLQQGVSYYPAKMTFHDFELSPCKSKSKEAKVTWDTQLSPGKQKMYFKFSRKTLTKEIRWSVNWTES